MQPEYVRKSWNKLLFWGFLVLIILIVCVNIVNIQRGNKSDSNELKFVTAMDKDLSTTKLISGTVVPTNEETFYLDPSLGEVKEIFVQEGQFVETGQKLFEYDNPELSFQIKQLEIDKQLTTLRYEQGKNKINSLKQEIQRTKDASSPKEIIAPLEEQLQELLLQQKTTELGMQKNKLQEEELKLKQKQLVVSSNFSGVVQKVDKRAGQNALQTSGVQGSVVQIASQEMFQIQGTLSELQKALIQPNQTVTVTSKAIANKKWTGKIINVGQYPTSDEISQTASTATGQSLQNISYYNFKAVLDSQDGLAPGYHVAIQVNIDSKKMLVVPQSSINEEDESKYVFVVNENHLEKRKISTGMNNGEWIEVIEGLNAGDQLVDRPSSDLYEGMEVSVK